MHSYVGVWLTLSYICQILSFRDANIECLIVRSVPDTKLDFPSNDITVVVRFAVQTAQIVQVLFTSSLAYHLKALITAIHGGLLGICGC